MTYPTPRLVPCTVKSVGPLTVTLADGSVVAAVSIAGLTYSAGQVAYAIENGTAPPIVLPIGS